jgi:hypothetical protein
MSKRRPNSGKRHMGRVARVPCVVCTHMGLGETPALVHHLKFGSGAADKESDFLTIALCYEHHVGKSGIHELKEHGFYARYKLNELDLLAMTLEALEA